MLNVIYLFFFQKVIISYLSLLSIFEVVHLASVRQFRMLTILKSIRSHPEILKIVNSMLAAVPNLSAVLILVIAVLVMWGIIGMFFYGNGKYSSEGAAREWSTVVIVIVIFVS